MSTRRETIAGTKSAKLSRVEEWFNGRQCGHCYEVEEFLPDRVGSARYAAFIDAWAAYLAACGWKDPGA
jgi:hypothetical protein